MMRYGYQRSHRSGASPRAVPARGSQARWDGFAYTLAAPSVVPTSASRCRSYSVMTVAPALRPLVQRTNGRCPECAGPLVSGEASVACPVCGFSRRG